jgi:hypothetical protein
MRLSTRTRSGSARGILPIAVAAALAAALMAGAVASVAGGVVTRVVFHEAFGRAVPVYTVLLPRSEAWSDATSSAALTKAYGYAHAGNLLLVRAHGAAAPGHLGAYLGFGEISSAAIPTDTTLRQYQESTVLRQKGISRITKETPKVGSAIRDKDGKTCSASASEVSYDATDLVSNAPVRVTDVLISDPEFHAWYTMELQATPATWPALQRVLDQALRSLQWNTAYERGGYCPTPLG